MIHTISHPVSEGLRKENEVHRRAVLSLTTEALRQLYPTEEVFFGGYRNSAEGAQLREALKETPPGARILDIGAGYGIVAIYLSCLGYRVTAVEPSPDLCAYIDRLAQLFAIQLDIYNVTAECLDRLPANAFDACMFNASLHHCDDPVQALRHCHRLLPPGGKLFLLNEPLLQFFRSKTWFVRQIAEGKLVTGDYGGNEHTYYHHEYLAMLGVAGFRDIRDQISLRYVQPKSYFHVLSCQGASRRSLLARRLYYRLVSQVCRSRVWGRPGRSLLKRLSLVQTNFTATKRCA
jgi:SAM-dependent methyltransferase